MRTIWIVLFSLLALPAFAGSVSEINKHKHLGVATCSNGVCHGAAQKFKESNVMQNEFSIWQEFDPHSRAFAVLEKQASKDIARKLGLGDPTKEKVCLDCHTDNVPAAQRGEKFQLDDGVGCETCHGGSELWIDSHADKTVAHQANLDKGLFPTENPVKRSELCLSCHVGTPDRMITHRIMGAGHPRLAFELDTFTWLHPHYEVDDDYLSRKGKFDGLRDWGVGQGTAAANAIDILLDPKHGWAGIFPELVLFDCHACHKKMTGNTWGPRQGTGLGPGVVRLNDSSLVLFRHVLSAVDRNAAQRIRDQTKSLHQATAVSRESTMTAAKNLRNSIRAVLPNVGAHQFEVGDFRAILDSILADGNRGEFRDYAAAEQAAMAVQSITVAFENAKLLNESQINLLRARVDALYSTVANDENYAMDSFLRELKSTVSAAP